MKISAFQYASALLDSVAGKSEKEVKAALKRFAFVLSKNRDLSKSEAIISAFISLWNKKNGEVDAKLLSARELPGGTQAEVVKYLKYKTGAAKINLVTAVDQGVLGGFILEYDSRILDGSLHNSLIELKNKISN